MNKFSKQTTLEDTSVQVMEFAFSVTVAPKTQSKRVWSTQLRARCIAIEP